MRVIISGGGTGGHIYPAIAIAEALKRRVDKVEILFVGAKGKMEMEKIPAAGYKIEGLDIAGFQRDSLLKNVFLPFKLIKSLMGARNILKDFKPDFVIGVGGYASGPLLRVAGWLGIPTFLQEQNSFAGVTNRLLSKKAMKIFVAFDNMDSYFPKEKIVFAGNPVRDDISSLEDKRGEALLHFGLDPEKKTILIFGGSLGAKALNEVATSGRELLKDSDEFQMIWQTGKFYNPHYKDDEMTGWKNVKQVEFISRMDLAYAAADIVICRAGALTISELAIAEKCSILVPSPNVAEDHQTKNAMALVEKEAALLCRENESKEKALKMALEVLESKERQTEMKERIKYFAKPKAGDKIVGEILNIVEK